MTRVTSLRTLCDGITHLPFLSSTRTILHVSISSHKQQHRLISSNDDGFQPPLPSKRHKQIRLKSGHSPGASERTKAHQRPEHSPYSRSNAWGTATDTFSGQGVQDVTETAKILPEHEASDQVADSRIQEPPTSRLSFLKRMTTSTQVKVATPRSSTSITREEKRIFDGLFSQMPSVADAHQEAKKNQEEAATLDPNRILDLFIPAAAVAPRQASLLREEVHLSANWDEVNERVQKFPPGLRRAARQLAALRWPANENILSVSSPHNEIDTTIDRSRSMSDEILTDIEKVDKDVTDIARAHMMNLSAELSKIIANKDAPESPDMAMWKKLGTDVFAMIKSAETAPLLKALQKPKEIEQQIIDELRNCLPADSGAGAALKLVTQLYPACLLLASRLLAKNFPSSPFLPALIPEVKSLGTTSFVLGASTPLYNEILLNRWTVYSDFEGMNRLLGEMEQGGVEFDLSTYGILRTIKDSRYMDTHPPQRHRSERAAWWWQLPATRTGLDRLLKDWLPRIIESLRAKGLGDVLSEREDRWSVTRADRHTEDDEVATAVNETEGRDTPSTVFLKRSEY